MGVGVASVCGTGALPHPRFQIIVTIAICSGIEAVMSKAKDSFERARGGRARSVGEVVPAVGGATFRRFGFVQSSIVSRWSDIVGAQYAKVSAPESLRFPQGKRADGVLTLTVSGAYAVTMQHVLPEITERVNRFFGYSAVARVVLKQGMVAKRAVAHPAPQLVALPEDLGDSLRSIADPELKAVLESLARGVATQAPMPLGKIR